jgi:hypothetical protein
LEGELADIGATRVGRQCPTSRGRSGAKQNHRRRAADIFRTPKLPNERADFSGFARNCVNDRDGYQSVKKAGACDTFPRGTLRKSTMGGIEKSARIHT